MITMKVCQEEQPDARVFVGLPEVHSDGGAGDDAAVHDTC